MNDLGIQYNESKLGLLELILLVIKPKLLVIIGYYSHMLDCSYHCQDSYVFHHEYLYHCSHILDFYCYGYNPFKYLITSTLSIL